MEIEERRSRIKAALSRAVNESQAKTLATAVERLTAGTTSAKAEDEASFLMFPFPRSTYSDE